MRAVALIVGVCGCVLLINLGGPRLWDRDEPRNAGCGAEMMHRGDWVTPVFNGQLRSHKPVLLYWFMMSAYAVFGVNEFAARFWSAVLASGTCLLTYVIGRRLLDARVGCWSAVILCTSLMFAVAGRAATPDSVLIFFTTAATAVYVLSVWPRDGDAALGEFPGFWPAALMYGLMGLAVLAKGPVGLVLPTAVIGMYLLLRRLPPLPPPTTLGQRLHRLLRPFAPIHFLQTCWRMRPLTALGSSLLVALPWYVWVGVRTDGAWLQGFFLEHNLGRALHSMEGHGGSPVYYLAALLAGFFPWSLLAPPALLAAGRTPRQCAQRPALVFCACWVGVYVGLFTLARTKLPSYVTPCYPGLALLTGWFLVRWMDGSVVASRIGPRLASGALAMCGVGLLIGLPLAADLLLPGERLLGLVGLLPLAGAAAAWHALQRGRRERFALAFAVTAVALWSVSFGWVSTRVSRHQQFGRLLAEIESRSAHPRIAACQCMEPSWAFYSQRRIHRVWIESRRGKQAIRRERSRPAWSPEPPMQEMQEFVRGGDAFVVTTDGHYRRMKDYFPPELQVVAEAPMFLRRFNLVLLHAPKADAEDVPAAAPAGAVAAADRERLY